VGSSDQARVVGSTLFRHTPDGFGRSQLATELTRVGGSRTARGLTSYQLPVDGNDADQQPPEYAMLTRVKMAYRSERLTSPLAVERDLRKRCSAQR
jgi:hypothetical protein